MKSNREFTGEQLRLAQHHINRETILVYDVAATHGQIFDNVKHMTWFLLAVAEELFGDWVCGGGYLKRDNQ